MAYIKAMGVIGGRNQFENEINSLLQFSNFSSSSLTLLVCLPLSSSNSLLTLLSIPSFTLNSVNNLLSLVLIMTMVSKLPFLRPSRVLLVSIHQMWYSVSVEALHQVFSPYGKVEKIEIHGSQAVIQYRWSLDAAVASRCLQGRNIYDGCCKMDIHYSEWVVETEFEEKLDRLAEKLKSVQELSKFEDSPVAHQLFDERSEPKSEKATATLEVSEPQTEKSEISVTENPPSLLKTSVEAADKLEKYRRQIAVDDSVDCVRMGKGQ